MVQSNSIDRPRAAIWQLRSWRCAVVVCNSSYPFTAMDQVRNVCFLKHHVNYLIYNFISKSSIWLHSKLQWDIIVCIMGKFSNSSKRFLTNMNLIGSKMSVMERKQTFNFGFSNVIPSYNAIVHLLPVVHENGLPMKPGKSSTWL